MLELPAPERAAPAAAGAQTAAPAAPAGAPRRTLVVMQPTFLPWAGYFNLMAQADDFVFLDDVQLEKQSWQTRNRLAFGGQALWLPVPVRHTHLAQTIAETEVLHASRWRDKLARGFAQNYARHPHLADAREVLDTLLAQPAEARLAALNEAVIELLLFQLRPRVGHMLLALRGEADGPLPGMLPRRECREDIRRTDQDQGFRPFRLLHFLGSAGPGTLVRDGRGGNE